jgi:hypothetical protein
MRVVLYAEGAGERGDTTAISVGDWIAQDDWGPAHWLVCRVLEVERRVPASAVQFEGPLRVVPGGRVATGSDLQEKKRLRRLLTWAQNPPELAVVLVDSDDELDRAQRLRTATMDIDVPHAIGAAVREFEAWLIADAAAVKDALSAAAVPLPPDPQALDRGAAKRHLADLCATCAPDRDARQIRSTIAQKLDLDFVAWRCPAFDELRAQFR